MTVFVREVSLESSNPSTLSSASSVADVDLDDIKANKNQNNNSIGGILAARPALTYVLWPIL